MSNVPGKTHIAVQMLQVTHETSIHLPRYNVTLRYEDKVKGDLKEQLEMGIIQTSMLHFLHLFFYFGRRK